jgi:predicted nucleic acid-binding protein
VVATNRPSTASAAAAEVIPLTQPSERVQAELFAKILRREIAAMKRNLTNAESEWQRRCESEGYVDPPERLAVAAIHRRCRRGGDTVRSLIDCQVAAMALRMGVAVVHRDHDYEVIRTHCGLQTEPLF